jgi:chromosome segregation ATPase
MRTKPTTKEIRNLVRQGIALAGSAAKLSRATGLSSPLISQWNNETLYLSKRGLAQFAKLQTFVDQAKVESAKNSFLAEICAHIERTPAKQPETPANQTQGTNEQEIDKEVSMNQVRIHALEKELSAARAKYFDLEKEALANKTQIANLDKKLATTSSRVLNVIESQSDYEVRFGLLQDRVNALYNREPKRPCISPLDFICLLLVIATLTFVIFGVL